MSKAINDLIERLSLGFPECHGLQLHSSNKEYLLGCFKHGDPGGCLPGVYDLARGEAQ